MTAMTCNGPFQDMLAMKFAERATGMSPTVLPFLARNLAAQYGVSMYELRRAIERARQLKEQNYG